jgi:Arc/MetJ-type ribon-helix-helix transcriptional regulator
MRIIVELPVTLGRRAAQAVEEGQYPSLDALVTKALTRLLSSQKTELCGSPSSVEALPTPAKASAEFDDMLGHAVNSPAPHAGWLWGMINRVFPLKVAARTCAQMSRTGPALLQDVHERFVSDGIRIGRLLAAYDRGQGRRRNESLAVGFPSSEEQKSQIRFAHQFLGRRSASGTYLGGAFETALIGVTEPGSDWVAPTRLGWRFAEIHNHVLDEGTIATDNLEDDECRFYLCQVAPQVPAEASAFAAILETLRREPLDASSLAGRLDRFQDRDLPDAVRNTSRSGALARLADVRGIRRVAVGRSARYEITSLGHEALAVLATTADST